MAALLVMCMTGGMAFMSVINFDTVFVDWVPFGWQPYWLCVGQVVWVSCLLLTLILYLLTGYLLDGSLIGYVYDRWYGFHVCY